MKKNLIIVAHPNYDISVVVKGILKEIEFCAENTDIHVLPTNGVFNVKEEQALLLGHESITFAFPFWWYNIPWTLKKYLDEVMQAGFAFSMSGELDDFKLKGKKFSYIVSVGNIEENYGKNSVNLHTARSFLNSLETLFHLLSTASLATGKQAKEAEYLNPLMFHYGGMAGNKEFKKVTEVYINGIDRK